MGPSAFKDPTSHTRAGYNFGGDRDARTSGFDNSIVSNGLFNPLHVSQYFKSLLNNWHPGLGDKQSLSAPESDGETSSSLLSEVGFRTRPMDTNSSVQKHSTTTSGSLRPSILTGLTSNPISPPWIPTTTADSISFRANPTVGNIFSTTSSTTSNLPSPELQTDIIDLASPSHNKTGSRTRPGKILPQNSE
ncbi:unnamed protein product [Echinostoma caproni]|uniref:Large S protein n=1 Tax=Echinostoma caproni TaxID=27848 RepID=A0A183B7W6_9TREM|nr:unnamed protein product [Echinostoma caproni]